MANWGVPDYQQDPKVDEEAIGLREKIKALGSPSEWPMGEYAVRPGYDFDSVQVYCVKDERWQKFRLSLKGKATHEKLEALISWWQKETNFPAEYSAQQRQQQLFKVQVQVGNYLGALRRGGQLDGQNRVRKWR